MHRVALFFLLIYSACVTKIDGKSCKYWCRTSHHRYYCCPTGETESWMEHAWHTFFLPWSWITIDKENIEPLLHSTWQNMVTIEERKHCPPLRTHCPRTYDWYTAPKLCRGDEDCGKWKRCCYDVCLEHKICKPTE